MTDRGPGGIFAWQKRLMEEVGALPEILVSLRETAANLKTVSDRLVIVTEALERTTRAAEETGLLTVLRRLDDASSPVRKAVGEAVGGDPGQALRQTRAMLDEVRARVEGIAQKIIAGPPPLDHDGIENGEPDEDDLEGEP